MITGMEITLVAMGMGDGQTLTLEGSAALGRANAIFGAPRLLENLPEGVAGVRVSETSADKIADAIGQNPEWKRVCVAYSGDTGFYSGAALLRGKLEGHAVKTLCGVSTVQYFAARTGRPWQDFTLASLHGRDCDIVALALNHRQVFCLTDAQNTPAAIARRLHAAGLGEARLTVGENLAAPGERILSGAAAELADATFAPLCVVLVENGKTFVWPRAGQGIPDDAFLRGGAPMTKQEVRAVALAKLGVRFGDVLYDIGAGTGSVAVEMALQARMGRVYAIEATSEGCALIRQNREKFGTYNLEVVEGMAPGALEGLPAPDRAFIGGSRRQLEPILRELARRRPGIRVVVAAVTLETLAQAGGAMEAAGLGNVETVQLMASRSEPLGRYTRLKAESPVFLISGGGTD